jgi:hypothetical protein
VSRAGKDAMRCVAVSARRLDGGRLPRGEQAIGRKPSNRTYLDLVATATTLSDDIGDTSGFTRRVTGRARIARFRSIGLHPVAMMMTSFLSVLLRRFADCSDQTIRQAISRPWGAASVTSRSRRNKR